MRTDRGEFLSGLIGGAVIDEDEAQILAGAQKGDEWIWAQPVRLVKTGNNNGDQGAPFQLPEETRERVNRAMHRKY